MANHLLEAKEFIILNFIEQFVGEQTEKKTLSRRDLTLLEVIGEEGIGRCTTDKGTGEKLKEGACKCRQERIGH